MTRRRHLPCRASRGFTLIELLVALFIAALMFAMGYGAIDQALQNRGFIRRHQQNLVQLETAMSVMEQDFVQLAPRPVRQPIGDGYLACLQGSMPSDASDASDASETAATSDMSDTAAPLVLLTRNGWSNPIGLQRSELERVAYVLDNGTLVREHWNVLDATLSSTPVKLNLLKHLRSVTFEYLSQQTHAWVSAWPPLTATGGGQDPYRERPMAVKVTLDTKEWGKIVRIFEIAQ
ncbi:MAG: type II secretion system minor pseudopilin GspJ [Steroidobacteraceae bacterium]